MKKPAKRPRANYVDNKRLYGEMIHFINQCRECEKNDERRPKIPEYIGECIFKIATGLAVKPNFSSYTYKDEMISDGIEVCIRYIHNFDPDKSTNPFAYFTQIIYYAFLQRIQKGQYFDQHHVIDTQRTADLESKIKPKKKGKVKLVGIEALLGDKDE